MLKVSNLSVVRGGISLLQDVTFEVQAGQALVLRGPNGIGKTRLLRCISGLQPPTSGEISAPESVAYAAHADGLKGQLSVLENLKFWADIYGGRGPEAALLAYDLEDLAQRPTANRLIRPSAALASIPTCTDALMPRSFIRLCMPIASAVP